MQQRTTRIPAFCWVAGGIATDADMQRLMSDIQFAAKQLRPFGFRTALVQADASQPGMLSAAVGALAENGFGIGLCYDFSRVAEPRAGQVARSFFLQCQSLGAECAVVRVAYERQDCIRAVFQARQEVFADGIFFLDGTGCAPLEQSWHLWRNTNGWSITGMPMDSPLAAQSAFSKAELWHRHIDATHRPCIGLVDPQAALSEPQVRSLVTLCCMLQSPLVIGDPVQGLSAECLALLQNRDVLGLSSFCHGAVLTEQGSDGGEGGMCHAVWACYGNGCPSHIGSITLMLCNLGDTEQDISADLSLVPGIEAGRLYATKDLWTGRTLFPLQGNASLTLPVPAADCALVRLS